MNLEEARNNIGAEVELDESTKPYTDADGIYESKGYVEQELSRGEFRLSGFNRNDIIISKEIGSETMDFLINPRHIKLKPQNYKIHVPTEEESREAQELFFELGYEWGDSSEKVKNTKSPYLYAFIKSKSLRHDQARHRNNFNEVNAKQITLKDLRDMVAKKKGEDKTLQVTGTFQDFEPRKEMTWQDAIRALADGKEVEYSYEGEWFKVDDSLDLWFIKSREAFRIAPKRIYLNGNFTKEELLQKAGEME